MHEFVPRTIGAAPQCDLVIDDPSVSSRHCQLRKDGPRFLLEDLQSTNGTFINNRRLTKPRPVGPEDAVRLGSSASVSWQQLESLAQTRIIRIGRDDDNDVALDSPAISGKHARLLINGKQLTIVDQQSTNGTSAGVQQRVITRASVNADDQVFFGSQGYRISELIRLADAAAAARSFTRDADTPSTVGPSANGLQNNRLRLWSAGLLAGICGLIFLVWMMRPASNDAPLDGSTSALTDHNSENPDQSSEALRSSAGSSRQPVAAASPVRHESVIYSLVVKTSASEPGLRVATAFAVDEHRLATSGNVVLFLKGSTDQFPVVVVQSSDDGREWPVEGLLVHPECESSVREANQIRKDADAAREKLAPPDETVTGSAEDSKPPTEAELNAIADRIIDLEDRWMAVTEKVIHYDVGLLTVQDKLPAVLPVSSQPLNGNAALSLVGVAFPHDQSIVSESLAPPLQLVSCTLETLIKPPERGDLPRLLVRSPNSHMQQNWLGAPVLDQLGNVAGVYSRPTPSLNLTEPPTGDHFDAASASCLSQLLSSRK